MEEKKIISPPSITKTKEAYHFPIPKECILYIENIKSGLLFPTIKKGSLYAIFQRLLKLTDIKFYEDKTLSMHDMRRLMLSIMIINCKIDSRLADACLSHKQSGVIQHYISFAYKDIKKSYKKYWKKIRN
jgi:integrase